MFIDAVFLAVLWIMVTSGESLRPQLPYLLIALSLAVVTGLLMADIVTTYGTLFRRRLLATVPLWLVSVGIRSGASDGGTVGSIGAV